MVVDKRTVLNENRERAHIRWTVKRGNEIDLIWSIECGVTPRSFPGVSKNDLIYGMRKISSKVTFLSSELCTPAILKINAFR